ncbi:hypothetical protein GCM10028796_17890 [Ramlibacter monticola]|uniref:Uncharacterized protein n=1 Tax=Ramlibacter monticola TaxID=1926872 RepID=A0A937CS10_9BURK|nr:hypothetical protein [Ramlibacter monticola]MBL0390616.1 hypothetical protein [Ramlibacter monticola]
MRAMQSLARPFVALAALLGAATLSPAALAASPAPVTVRAPVMVAGLWCGAGLLRNYVLDIAQEYQRVEAKLIKRGRVHELTGHMDGPILRADPQRDHTMELLAEGDELRIIDASGILALARGQFFTRAVGGSCTH